MQLCAASHDIPAHVCQYHPSYDKEGGESSRFAAGSRDGGVPCDGGVCAGAWGGGGGGGSGGGVVIAVVSVLVVVVVAVVGGGVVVVVVVCYEWCYSSCYYYARGLCVPGPRAYCCYMH